MQRNPGLIEMYAWVHSGHRLLLLAVSVASICSANGSLLYISRAYLLPERKGGNPTFVEPAELDPGADLWANPRLLVFPLMSFPGRTDAMTSACMTVTIRRNKVRYLRRD